jgi:cation diffusion facilitator family transporter
MTSHCHPHGHADEAEKIASLRHEDALAGEEVRVHRHPDGHEHGSEERERGAPAHGRKDSHGHLHAPQNGPLGWLLSLPFLHSHAHTLETDVALETSAKGIRAVQISLFILGATAAFQVAVVVASGSVALLADTIHNFTDALTALPLWLAFVLGRRPASRRYTHGFGRAEDLAGVLIVLIIIGSAVVAAYAAYQKLVTPRGLSHIEWVMAAAIVGFVGNECVALFRIRVGGEIGSAALIADGQHARIDGLTSLAVLAGALGVLAGLKRADPLVGLLIMFAILFIVKDAAVMVWQRLMDAVDPDITHELEHAAELAVENFDQVEEINSLKVRWVGHKLQAEINLIVDGDITTRDSHALADQVRQSFFAASSYISSVIVHVEPHGHGDEHAHGPRSGHS